MNIAVCIKQVPDTAELKLDPETNTLIRDGVDAVLNPLDDFALEAALRLRQAAGGTVTAVTMGPPQAEDILRKARAMGVDEAVLVSDRAFAGADTWATSLTLAMALRQLGPYDLILCGKQAIDGDTAQVGPGIAAHLGIPQVTYVTRIDWHEGRLLVNRLLDGGTVRLAVPLPACLTVLKEANEPRLPTLAARVDALRDQPRRMGLGDVRLPPKDTGLEGSPTRVVRIRVPTGARQLVRLEGSPEDIVERLADVLRTP